MHKHQRKHCDICGIIIIIFNTMAFSLAVVQMIPMNSMLSE